MEIVPRRPRTTYLHHSVEVPGPPEALFRYIADRQSQVYPTLAAGHESFRTADGLALHHGSEIECRESAGPQRVLHHYRVHDFRPGVCLAYSSTPSLVTIQLPSRTFETKSHSHVWYHFEASDRGTKVRITIAIEFLSWFEYLFSVSTGGLCVWEQHCVEEMYGLRTAYLLSQAS